MTRYKDNEFKVEKIPNEDYDQNNFDQENKS